jgi:hypothetical protein
LPLVPSTRHGNSCKRDDHVRCCLEAVSRTTRAAPDECTCQPPGSCPAVGRQRADDSAFDCGSFELCCLPAAAADTRSTSSLSLHDAVQIFEPSPQFVQDVSVEAARVQEAPPKIVEPEKPAQPRQRDITIIHTNTRNPAPIATQPQLEPFEVPVDSKEPARASDVETAPRRFFHRFFGPKPHVVLEDKPLKFQSESEPEQHEVPAEVTAALEKAGIRPKPPGVHIDENKTLVIDGGAPVILLNEEDQVRTQHREHSPGRVQFPAPFNEEVGYQEKIPPRVEPSRPVQFSPRFGTTTTTTTTTASPTTTISTPTSSTSDSQTDGQLFGRVLNSLWHVARLLVYDRSASVFVVGDNSNEPANFTITAEEARTLAKLIAKISPSGHRENYSTPANL